MLRLVPCESWSSCYPGGCDVRSHFRILPGGSFLQSIPLHVVGSLETMSLGFKGRICGD